MFFYKVEGMLFRDVAEEEMSQSDVRERAVKSYTFRDTFGQGAFCFVAEFSGGVLTVGVIAKQNTRLDETLDAYFSHIDCVLKDVVKTEITYKDMESLLSCASRRHYIDTVDGVFEKYELDKIRGRVGPRIYFGENIIEENPQETIYDKVKEHLLDDAFLPELDRIYAGRSTAKAYGHPVHYLLQITDVDVRREAHRALLEALYANNRLTSKRYCYIDFSPNEGVSRNVYSALYKMCVGGAIVVRYQGDSDFEEDEFAGSDRELIETLCEVAKTYRNQVLTIFCIPSGSKNTKALFYENLGSMTFVEIQENVVDGERARCFLKTLAKENHVRTDKALFDLLEEGRGYQASELHKMFDDWYNNKLKTTIYPQYKNIHKVTQKVAKATPKGTAYDELQEMVGLTEAKAVMQKALNYYKMQKLYEEKGLRSDTPAMHMVFSGNPGTAKTTAARLFARIMKDNGLLSSGQLVEVGRGDLVGKFVGWTAKTVQAKFRAAMGGVLFIDEAYSLVDDRNGSFGDEAINTIVQEMENHREDVVVIFAGYPDEMERFLQKNPGLRSRIAFHVPFADYDVDELCEIATMIGKKKGVTFEKAAIEKLGALFESARKQSDFGNGRYVRNVLEQAKMNQASRLLEEDFDLITTEEITTIRAVDIAIPDVKIEEKRQIGFAC